jgi:hypothetical protein
MKNAERHMKLVLKRNLRLERRKMYAGKGKEESVTPQKLEKKSSQ